MYQVRKIEGIWIRDDVVIEIKSQSFRKSLNYRVKIGQN